MVTLQGTVREFHGILNKLTPEKFETLAERALSLSFDSKAILDSCVRKIYTKVKLPRFLYFAF